MKCEGPSIRVRIVEKERRCLWIPQLTSKPLCPVWQEQIQHTSHGVWRITMNRRTFLKTGALSVLAFHSSGVPAHILASATRAASNSSKVLVCVFQRGAMDGLMAVQPFEDRYFIQARNRLRMPMGPDSGLLNLDGRFALHPAFSPFKRYFDEKRLAIVHGIGSPDSTRSHFDAQDYMENGTPGRKSSTGWMSRAASELGLQQQQGKTSPFQCVSLTPALPLAMTGPFPALAIDDLKNFRVQDKSMQFSNASSFEALYAQSTQEQLRSSGAESFAATHLLDSLLKTSWSVPSSSAYPTTNLGKHFRDVAQIIKARIGLRIAFIESDGWDTHVQQGTRNGQFSRVAGDFAQSIAAFWEDLGAQQDDVCLLTMTEFGRTVRENGSGGTDHGRASCMFVLSNSAHGGRVLGDVPTLAPENLADGRDLPVTTDFRALFSGIAHQHLRLPSSAELFAGWDGADVNVLKS